MANYFLVISDAEAGQRVDNFLIKNNKGVPRSRIHRAIRKGELRVNKGRVKSDYKLQLGDSVRMPPLRTAEKMPRVPPSDSLARQLEEAILLEDEGLIIINKPANIPVHGGTDQSAGLIEMLRIMRPKQTFLELVHRLDKGTSGCLLIAKKRPVLLALHHLLQNGRVNKQYVALVKGVWRNEKPYLIDKPLLKQQGAVGGSKKVVVSDAGKEAKTQVRLLKQHKHAALIEATLLTGRTHQIRVHCAHIGHPVVGDARYGDFTFNRDMKKQGVNRLCLHAYRLRFTLPGVEKPYDVSAPQPF